MNRMAMKMEHGYIYIINVDPIKESMMKSWSNIKKNRKTKMWVGLISRDLLNRLRRLTPLPRPIEEVRIHLNKVQEAVDRERVTLEAELKPMAQYPVKKKLYAHQTRAANMALLTFGLVEPSEEKDV